MSKRTALQEIAYIKIKSQVTLYLGKIETLLSKNSSYEEFVLIGGWPMFYTMCELFEVLNLLDGNGDGHKSQVLQAIEREFNKRYFGG